MSAWSNGTYCKKSPDGSGIYVMNTDREDHVYSFDEDGEPERETSRLTTSTPLHLSHVLIALKISKCCARFEKKLSSFF